MNLKRATSQRLHSEHMAVLDLLARLSAAFGKSGLPDRALYRDAAALIAGEVAQHFEFEERACFPHLEAAGEGDLCSLLAEEHVVIRAAAAEFVPLARRAADGALSAEEARRFRVVGLELCERLAAHAQKEELSLVPALEDALDADADRAAALANPA